MQADKCRTSGRSVKKELVIESPLQCKDAAQGEVEAESPGPVPVRGAQPGAPALFPTSAFAASACLVPSGLILNWPCLYLANSLLCLFL